MRSHTSSLPTRRTIRRAEQRTRRRPALIAATLAIGVIAAAGVTATAPTTEAQASAPLTGFALASYSPTSLTTSDVITTDESIGASDAALAGADTSIAAATTVTADIASSGLDVGTSETTIDTAALEAAMDRLERAEVLPAAYVSEFTDEVTTLASSVDEKVAGLRGKLDAAIALKAEQEAAAERARLEAEAAAAAQAAEAAAKAAKPKNTSAPSPVYATGGAVGGTSPADAQATARSMMGGYGWGDDQFACLVSLWNKESGWNYQAHNRSSGAYGIPQALPGSKMSSAGADWQTNPATQIAWGLGYITGRYGTPCGAWGHSQSTGWY